MKHVTRFLLPSLLLSLLLLMVVTLATTCLASDDILIADFEAETYGEWKATGTAFGPGPAAGTLPNQMFVNGFCGERLVNSFYGGDDAIGTLTSNAFAIERRYLSFLIGGGGYARETCMQLIVDGKAVREEVGPNVAAGGSEELQPAYWDVGEFKSQTAQLRIVDSRRGGWGHINIDHITMTDTKPPIGTARKSFAVDQPYLLIPIKNGVPKVTVEVIVSGKAIRRYSTELALRPDDVDWYAFFNLQEYIGKTAEVSVSRTTDAVIQLLRPSASIPAAADQYNEVLRPQLHFSQLVGWNNDPNGMTYLNGQWHLFFQHNPVGWNWGNMTWGHAVSRDLIHWEQMPNVLFPETMAKGACFSGGAVIDRRNTSGFKQGDHDLLVAFLTDTGAGESLAYSNDRGRSFQWYEKNPIVKHNGRDPKVIWYAYKEGLDKPLNDRAKELGGHWVMAVYDESPELGQNIAFYVSTDLKQWAHASNLRGYFECPELFQLPVQRKPNQSRWVVFAADAKYALGQFDGRTFTPDHPGKHQLHYGDFYASQTFDNPPDSRRIQIGWMRGVEMPDMPFNQAFSIPHELTLRDTPDGLRMSAAPVRELATLRTKEYVLEPQSLSDGDAVALPVEGELFDIAATFEIGHAASVGIDVGGNRVRYDAGESAWNSAATKPTDGRVSVRVLLDRSLMEIWGNEGAVVISGPRKVRGDVTSITAYADGGDAKLIELKAYRLRSIWKQQPPRPAAAPPARVVR
ncbi:MAG: glycoside hydrolase family 32 protein [Pirellulaceae bacterium]